MISKRQVGSTDTLIRSILQIEADAQKIVAQARARQARFEEECAKKRAEMETDIGSRCERRIAKMQETEEAYRNAEIEKIRTETKRRQSEMETRFEKNRDEWVRLLADNIVGGE